MRLPLPGTHSIQAKGAWGGKTLSLASLAGLAGRTMAPESVPKRDWPGGKGINATGSEGFEDLSVFIISDIIFPRLSLASANASVGARAAAWFYGYVLDSSPRTPPTFIIPFQLVPLGGQI